MENTPGEQIVAALRERAKELNCLYRVDEILSRAGDSVEEGHRELIAALPAGWQYPEVCHAQLKIGETLYRPDGFLDSPWCMTSEIIVMGDKVGEISVCYTEKMPKADEGPFLKEERRLLDAIAQRIALSIMQRRIRSAHRSWKSVVESMSSENQRPGTVLLDFLQRTDPGLLVRITRKMINHLCWTGVKDADELLKESFAEAGLISAELSDENRPIPKRTVQATAGLIKATFDLATSELGTDQLVKLIQGWINEEKSTFLIKSLENPGTGLSELAEAVERYQSAGIEESELQPAVRTSLRVALLRRFFIEQLSFINVAKRFVDVRDFYGLVSHLIYPLKSQGKLGGKGAGLFLATQVVMKAEEHSGILANLKVPKTWYVASDAVLEFIQYNNLNEVYNRKYMEIERIRQDHRHIVHLFKGSRFPPEITKGLATALDDFGDRPLIVRSSSLLEDRAGASFSGKYKSLFVANQGSKRQRLEALQDAIAEVYASVFAPDPIEYRAERGLLDFREEMAILIQEVVGRRVGKYFLPAFSGVAFSNNEFRWSSRIRREDGLVRLVPGLGTRAVDRLSDDYPVLVAPGQPRLRVNVTPEEIVRYSPKKMDVIDLERNIFVTVDAEELFRTYGDRYPMGPKLVSLVERESVRKPTGLEPDWEKDDFVVTFEGLLSDTNFMLQMKTLMDLLRERLGTPVDIEFAVDGNDLYLLQCRAQSYNREQVPASIPRNLPMSQVVFSADRHISNGRVPDITHIVYVDPEAYANLSELEDIRDVGRVVGMLNQFLPKRQFILIGPGRWGSRGDIKLGVNVSYSDINNTAVLLEVAYKKGNYLPELSFGTHFFQDLVEAQIRYIPLYPDEPNIRFNKGFLRRARNLLPEILPDYARLAETVRVIDVPSETDGQILRVLMNADLDEAVGIFAKPSTRAAPAMIMDETVDAIPEDHWRWRLQMAEKIAAHLDAPRFGVKALYVLGSTKNATAGPASDIDLIVHVADGNSQRQALATWLEGWSLALAEVNYLRTGYRSHGLLDIHYVTDQDIANQTSFAAKIGAITDAARKLDLRGMPSSSSS